MRLYDTISQSDLNDAIDLLVYNYHRELSLDIDDPSNSYCSLGFDLSDGVDAGEEVIFNSGDNLRISVDDKRLALMGYTLRFYYYLLDKGDYSDSKSYGDLRSFDVKLDSDEVVVPFTDNQVYLQKTFELVLLKDIGYRLLLSTPSSTVMLNDDVVLTADYTLGSVPVEDATVEFYNGETLLGTGVTDSDGLAVLTVSNLAMGSFTFNAVVDGVYSNDVPVTVSSDKVMELRITGAFFPLYGGLTYNGRVFVDWGDNTSLIEYTGSRINHNYASSGEYTIKVYGEITSIGNYYFERISNLISITIPESVTSLGEYCFSSCTGLTSIELPSSVTSLGASCFYNCTGLTSIELPQAITTLGEYCFHDCSGLSSISIPSSVTSLGQYCFFNCSSLTSIQLYWTGTKIRIYRSNWISGTSSSLKFSIPNGTTSDYTAKSYPSDKLEERT